MTQVPSHHGAMRWEKLPERCATGAKITTGLTFQAASV